MKRNQLVVATVIALVMLPVGVFASVERTLEDSNTIPESENTALLSNAEDGGSGTFLFLIGMLALLAIGHQRHQYQQVTQPQSPKPKRS
ncbi:MAG: hypothetical protein Q8P93_04005 [bacterium]|nr:hypothetical protein [bacterium]